MKVIDDHELIELDLDLAGSAARTREGSAKILRQSGRLIQREMRRDARGHRYLPKFAAGITTSLRGPWEVEVGFRPTGRKGSHQGSLAHIIVNGSVNNDPVYDHRIAWDRVEPRVIKLFEDMAEDAVLGGRG